MITDGKAKFDEYYTESNEIMLGNEDSRLSVRLESKTHFEVKTKEGAHLPKKKIIIHQEIPGEGDWWITLGIEQAKLVRDALTQLLQDL